MPQPKAKFYHLYRCDVCQTVILSSDVEPTPERCTHVITSERHEDSPQSCHGRMERVRLTQIM